MKKYFTLLFCCLSFALHAQPISISFDDTSWRNSVFIDTSYHNNIWQVGRPHKAVFTAAFSSPNVIVTDTSHPYPAGDTSVFTVKVPATVPCIFGPAPLYHMQFFYQLNIDTGAHAGVEISLDKGRHWVNTRDSLPMGFAWDTDTARLDTSTTGWQVFKMYVSLTSPHDTDSVFFRYTFITDTGAAGKDGWMMDNFNFWYWCEGAVKDIAQSEQLLIYPNPARDHVYLHLNQPVTGGSGTVTITGMDGRQVYRKEKVKQDEYLYLPLPPGTYLLEYTSGDERFAKQIVIGL